MGSLHGVALGFTRLWVLGPTTECKNVSKNNSATSSASLEAQREGHVQDLAINRCRSPAAFFGIRGLGKSV